MDQHSHGRTRKPAVAANWETLRIANFDREGTIIGLSDRAKFTADAQTLGIRDTIALPPAFTTLEAADDFAQQVIASYAAHKFIHPCFTGTLVEQKEFDGATYFTPFVRVSPSPFAPGQPNWADTLKLAQIISEVCGESSDELRQHDGTIDTNHQRGRVMVNKHGQFHGVLFVGGNSLNKLVAPGVLWFLAEDGGMGKYAVE